MLRYNTLENCDLQTIYATFSMAFSDYIVPMKPTFSQFENILLRRGFNSALSIGAFEEGQLVGFIFSSCRTWHDRKTLYTISVGVIPSYRGRKIAENLYLALFEIAKNAGITAYLLEVITTNSRAIKLYEKLGFKQHRTLHCFSLKKPLATISLEESSILDHPYKITIETKMPNLDITKLIDYPSSWQYSLDSIYTDPQGFYYVIARTDQEIAGILIVDRETAAIFQIVVAKNHRHQKLATAMLTALKVEMPEKNFSLSNIDNRNHSLIGFIESLQFEPIINQYEMLKVI